MLTQKQCVPLLFHLAVRQGDSSITCYMNLRQCPDANSAKALNSDLKYHCTGIVEVSARSDCNAIA